MHPVQGRGGKIESRPVTPAGSWRWLVGLFVRVVALDQVTKAIALATLGDGRSVPVIGDLVRWTLTQNPGGVFGTRLGTSTYYLISSLFIFGILVYYVIRHRDILHVAIPLSIVSGGALGNVIDRIRFGRVVDFIDCDFPDIQIGSYSLDRWPIFNIADMAVSCGIITTIVLVFYHSRKARQTAPLSAPASNAAPPGDNQPDEPPRQ
jgi:signal peptidase II